MGIWGRKRLENRIHSLVPRLYAIAHSWGCTRDTCDDLIQETISIGLDKYKQLRNPDLLDGWIIRILVNTHRQHLRKGKWLTTLDNDELIEEHGPVSQLESNRTIERVQRAISLLSDEHRKVLVLVDMEGMSYREVASVLDIKLGTVMSRLGRARNNLRKVLNLRKHTSHNETQENKLVEIKRANLRRIK